MDDEDEDCAWADGKGGSLLGISRSSAVVLCELTGELDSLWVGKSLRLETLVPSSARACIGGELCHGAHKFGGVGLGAKFGLVVKGIGGGIGMGGPVKKSVVLLCRGFGALLLAGLLFMI